jgi:hypothetical protein
MILCFNRINLAPVLRIDLIWKTQMAAEILVRKILGSSVGRGEIMVIA